MKIILSLISVFLLSCLACSQGLDDKIQLIRNHYYYVENNLESFDSISKEEYEMSADGGDINYYYEDKELVKISLMLYGETGKLSRGYYVKDDILLFIFDQHFNYNVPYYIDSTKAVALGFSEWFDPDKTTIDENRYYFFNSELVRWINSDGELVDPSMEKFLESEKKFLQSFKEINER